jgi:hypothetical protein
MRGYCSPTLKRSWRTILQDTKTQWPRRYGTVAESPSLTTPPSAALDEALEATSLRNTWTRDEIKQIYETPLMKLAYAAVSLFGSAALLRCYYLWLIAEYKITVLTYLRERSTGNSTTPPPCRCVR